MTNFGFEALGAGGISGGLTYLGTWDAALNIPVITSGVGTPGDYYIVSVPGNTTIDGISDWAVGDWIIFSSTGVWQKIDNSDLEGYNLIQEEGVSLPKESIIDFQGAGVTATAGIGKTIVTIPGASSGRYGIADSSGSYTYYSTLTLAMAAAVAGQTIEVFTDYTEAGAVTITLKPSVTINGNGHTYTHNGGANVFKINDNGTYAILGLNVTKTGGGGTAVITTTPDLYPGQPALNTSTNLSGSTFKSDGSGIYCSFNDVNEFYYAKIVMTGGGIYGLYGPSTNFSHFSIEGLAAYSGTMCFSGQLNMCYVVNRGSGLALSDLAIADSYVVSYSSQAAGGIYAARNCFFFSGTGTALQPANNGIIDNCKMYSSASAAASLYNTNATFNNCSMYSNSAQGFYASLTQTVKLNNCVIQSGSNIALEALAPIVSNCVIESLWNNANGHAVNILNSSFVIQNCSIKVANASANCLYATAAVSPKYVANSFQGATTSVNANVTQGMINTDDAYGNITI